MINDEQSQVISLINQMWIGDGRSKIYKLRHILRECHFTNSSHSQLKFSFARFFVWNQTFIFFIKLKKSRLFILHINLLYWKVLFMTAEISFLTKFFIRDFFFKFNYCTFLFPKISNLLKKQTFKKIFFVFHTVMYIYIYKYTLCISNCLSI